MIYILIITLKCPRNPFKIRSLKKRHTRLIKCEKIRKRYAKCVFLLYLHGIRLLVSQSLLIVFNIRNAVKKDVEILTIKHEAGSMIEIIEHRH